MGRSFFADASVQYYLDGLISRNESFVGLVVGQMQFMQAKDLIVRLVPTPAASNENADEKSSKKCLQIDAIEDQYIANHARQVLRMLSGGFDVIGIFVCINPDEAKNIQTRLRQVLFAVHKVLSKVDCLVGCYAHTERLIMQICRMTKKVSCRTFDVSDPKSTGNPCELKFQKVVDSFLQMQTTFSLDLVIPVQNAMMNSSLQKQLMAGLQPVFQSITASVATINNRLLPDGEPLHLKTPQTVKSRRNHKNDIGDGEGLTTTFRVDLLEESQSSSSSEIAVLSCGAKMLVRGTVASKAYATSKSTAADAVQMLKKDIVRSIVARCELLCEDLLQAEEEQDVKILYETPLRVFVKLPAHEPVQFCDYLFPDETVSESAGRFSELLGLEICEEDIDTQAEHVPNESDLLKPVKPTTTDMHLMTVQSLSSSSQHAYRYIGMASTVVAASVAALVSWWYSSFSDQI